MRALVVVSVILLAIIGGWFFIFQAVEQQTSSFIDTLDTIESSIKQENWDTVAMLYPQVQRKWKTLRNRWAILLDHHEIDNIDLSMAKAEQYVKVKDKALSLGEIEVLKQLFEIVKESEALTLTNVL